MSHKSLWVRIVLSLVMAMLATSVATAQEPGGGDKPVEVTPVEPLPTQEENSVEVVPEQEAPAREVALPPDPNKAVQGKATSPLGEVPDFDPAAFPGQEAKNSQALQQALLLYNSLTPEQRNQIKNLLEANRPSFLDQPAATLQSGGQLSVDELKNLNTAGAAWAGSLQAGMQSILTPEQFGMFQNSGLTKPADVQPPLLFSDDSISAQAQGHCATSYNMFAEIANGNGYYATLNAYYAYLSGSDSYYGWYVYAMISGANELARWAGDASYYAYWNYYSAYYGSRAYVWGVHSTGLFLYGYQLANTMYTWTGNSNNYYAGVYGQAAYNASETADNYATACYQ